MASENLFEKIKSWFGKGGIVEPAKNGGRVAKKPYRGPTPSELEKGIYADMQDYHDGQITDDNELQEGRKYKWFFGDGKSTHLIFHEVGKDGILMESVAVPGHKKWYSPSEFGFKPVETGCYAKKWKKGHYLLPEK